MAAHIRTQIRHAVAQSLSNLASVPASRVFVNRTASVVVEQGPYVVIATPSESLEVVGIDAPQRYRREMTIGVEVVAPAQQADDALDAVAREIEPAIDAAGLLGGLVKQPLVLDSARMDFDDLASPRAGRLTMTYRTHTYTTAAAPDTVI